MKYIFPIVFLVFLSSCSKSTIGSYTKAPCYSLLKDMYINDTLDFYLTTFGDTEISWYKKGYSGFRVKGQTFLLSNARLDNGFDSNIYHFSSLDSYLKKVSRKNLKNFSLIQMPIITRNNQRIDSVFQVNYKRNKLNIVENIVKIGDDSYLRFVGSVNPGYQGDIDYLELMSLERAKLLYIKPNSDLESDSNNFFKIRKKLDSLFGNNHSYQIKYLQKLYRESEKLDPITIKQLNLEYVNLYNKTGDYKAAYHYQTLFDPSTEQKTVTTPNDSTSNLDFETIQDFVKTHSNKMDVFILNDHHSFPITRWVGAIFLEELYKTGFRYLAVETLANWEGMESYSIINYKNGYYSDEPTFNLFLQLALKKGFKLIPYENYNLCSATDKEGNKDRAYCMNLREENQASNIAKIYNKDPNAKIFVFAGHGHGKRVKKDKFTPMGYILDSILSAKNVVSVDQVSLLTKNENRFTIDNLRNRQFSRTPAFIKERGAYYAINEGFDAVLSLPIIKAESKNLSEYSHWYYQKNDVNNKRIELEEVPEANWVKIYIKDEREFDRCQKIPVFQSELIKLDKTIIYLPSDFEYQINYYDQNDKLIKSN